MSGERLEGVFASAAAQPAHPSISASNGAALKIEKGIPMPVPDGRVQRAGPKRRHQYDLIEIGDSVLFPDMNQARMVRNWAYRAGRQFIQRKVRGGWRIWRIS